MNRRIIATMALAGLLLTACSGSGNGNGGEGADGADTTDAGGQTTTTVDIRVVPPTLPAGQEVELGSVESTIQELEQPCADAIQPIRDLQKKYQSGLEVKPDDLPAMNEALNEGFASCSADDWKRYLELELQGWLNAVPSDEAIEQAQQDFLENQENAAEEPAAEEQTAGN